MIDSVIISSPQARVLVVDDEISVCSALARSLTLLGYSADAAASGHEALAMLECVSYDAIVLDIRMPSIDGVEVMQQARRMCPDLSIILLTGHATLESAIAAVKMQAVDYLLKPATVYDIAAAIGRALQHRYQEDLRWAPTRYMQAGPLTLDRERSIVRVRGDSGEDGLEVELTISEAALLVCFMEHPDEVISCRDLARTALDYDVSEIDAQDIVRPHISRLRQKIEPDPSYPRMIITVYGKGYLFNPKSPNRLVID